MRHGWIAAAALLAIALPATAQDAATISLSQSHAGTVPRAISGNESIHVDLSSIPPGTAVHRAVLRPGRIEGEAFTHRDRAVRVTLEGQDQPLPLLPPRFVAFDVTAEVRAALAAGKRAMTFNFEVFPGYQAAENRLDITCAARAKREIPRVEELTAIHRAGQTLLTWKEPLLKDAPEKLTFREWVVLRDTHAVTSR